MAHHRRYLPISKAYSTQDDVIRKAVEQSRCEPLHCFIIGDTVHLSPFMYRELQRQLGTTNNLVPATSGRFAGKAFGINNCLPEYRLLSKSARRFRRKYKGPGNWEDAYKKYKDYCVRLHRKSKSVEERGIVVPRGFHGGAYSGA